MNILKRKLLCGLLVLSAVFSILSVSCSKDEEKDDYIVKVNTKEIILTNDAQVKELKVTASGEWHFEATGLEGSFGVNSGIAEWYTLSPMFGDNNQTVFITLKEGITSDKSTILKIVGKNNTEKVNIKFSIQ